MKRNGIILFSIATLSGLGALVWHLFTRRKNKPSTEKSSQQGGTEGSPINSGKNLTEPNWDNPLYIGYMSDVMQWVAPKKVLKLKDDYADQLAQEIYKAKGRYILSNDDEAAVKNVFSKKVKDKVQASNIAQAFFTRYKKDLKQYLQSFLSTSELQTNVYQPIAQLKNYREA